MAIDYRKQIVASALKYVGTQEPKGDDQFIAAYNKYANAKFGVDSTPWCAIFVTFNARMVGVPTTIIPNFASCGWVIENFFKPKGLWKERGQYTPQPGDLIFYDWNADKRTDHVGIVVGVENGKVLTVEGNTKGTNGVYGVWQKSYVLNSRYILGYGTPDYAGSSTSAVSNQSQLSTMVKGTYVVSLKKWLNSTYKTNVAVNSSVNAELKKALIMGWQCQMNASYKTKLAIDGSFGPACRAAASKRTLKQKTSGRMVYLLQGCLYAHGYDPKGFDGSFGPGCLAAVKAFQRARKLEVDGVVGVKTWESLLTKW